MIDLLFINMCSSHGVHPMTTSAIIKNESGYREAALNINSRAVSFASLGLEAPRTTEQAIRLAERLQQMKVNFDAGLMQINSANFRAMGLTAADAFDPCKNIRAGTGILKRFYDRAERDLGPGQIALKAALSAYNTGNHRDGFENGYVAKFYGKKLAHVENPYTISMVVAPMDAPKEIARKGPGAASMIPKSGGKGGSDDQGK